MYQLFFEVLVNFIPEPADACLDHICLRVKTVIPDTFHDHGFGNHPAGIAHQVLKQGGFLGLQVDLFFSAPVYGSCQQVDGQVVECQAGGLYRAVNTAQQRLYPASSSENANGLVR